MGSFTFCGTRTTRAARAAASVQPLPAIHVDACRFAPGPRRAFFARWGGPRRPTCANARMSLPCRCNASRRSLAARPRSASAVTGVWQVVCLRCCGGAQRQRRRERPTALARTGCAAPAGSGERRTRVALTTRRRPPCAGWPTNRESASWTEATASGAGDIRSPRQGHGCDIRRSTRFVRRPRPRSSGRFAYALQMGWRAHRRRLACARSRCRRRRAHAISPRQRRLPPAMHARRRGNTPTGPASSASTIGCSR